MTPPPTNLMLLSRPDCHLCDVVATMAARLQAERPFAFSRVDISTDPSLERQYGHRIPVVLVDGVERLSGVIRERDLRRELKKARWRRPISRILSCLGYRGTAPKQG